MYLTNLSNLGNGALEDAFDNFFNFPVARETWDTLGITGPQYKTAKDTLMVSLPGFSKKDINLEIKGQLITISAEDKDNSFAKGFTKKFRFPEEIDMDSITAKMSDGILTLNFKPSNDTKKINIK